MPKHSKGKYSPNSIASQNDSTFPLSQNDGAAIPDEGVDAPQNGRNSAPQKYALTSDEVEKLQDKNSLAEHIEYEEPGCCQKYSKALKLLLPFRPPRKNKNKLPSNKAGLISFFSLTWLTQLMCKAYRKGLEPSDLWELQDEDCSASSCARVQRLWQEERAEAKKKGAKPELARAVWRSAKTRVLVTMFISLFYNMFQFLGPSIFLKLTLDYINDPLVDHYYGARIVALIFMNNILRGATFNVMFVLGSHTATRVCGGLQSLIYQKVLKLKSGGEKISAQITNILTNDMERLFEAVISSVFISASPMLLLLSASYSVYLIGPWALLGIGCYLMFYPIMGGIAKAQSRLRVKTVKKTDKRVGLMTEILNNLKLIKMYAWEDSFSNKIAGIRREELKRHRFGALLQAISSTMVPSISILATISTLLGYTLTGLTLTSSEAFTIHSVFTAMQFTVGVLPFTVRSIAEAKISLARIQKLLDLPENTKQVGGLMNNNLALVIKNATFAFETHSIDLKARNAAEAENKDKEPVTRTVDADPQTETTMNGPVLNNEETEKSDLIHRAGEETTRRNSSIGSSPSKSASNPASPHRPTVRRLMSVDGSVEMCETLFGVNLSVERGRLIGVCGSVGAGKSSLVSAIVGDMKLSSGFLHVNGRIALVTQQAWIYNATLRENILVGAPFDEERYKRVIDVCALQSDVDQLPDGDLTEIGDRGVNLSGGQKQRVNMARALYSDRDIYLLDDPLSAVDTKVAKHLFNKCIKGALKEKTVLLVCHGMHFLEQCDEVILMKGGRICERGTHQSLMDRGGEYFEMAGFSFGAEAPTADAVEIQKRKRRESEMENKITDDVKADGKLVQEETKAVGGVSGKVYLTFIKVCGGWCICMLVLLVIISFNLIRIFNTIWLQLWLDHGDGLEELRLENRTMYNVTYSNDELKGDITQNPNLWIFQLVYGMSFVALIFVGIFKGIGIAFRVLSGASRLHRDMFNSILRTPMSFLDKTPSGRILNRFSRDMDEVDVRVPFFLEFVVQGTLSILAQITMVCFFFPLFVIPLLIITVLFIFIDFFLNSGIRELKRLDNNLKSPVIQHLSSSVSGLSVIRSFDKERVFVNRFNALLDKHSAALLVFRLSNRWFTYRMDLMATIVTLAITIICVFTKGHFSTAIAGLALSSVIGVCSFIPFLMRMKSEFQSRLTSVERIIEYAYELEHEAPHIIKESQPPESWPNSGAIEIRDVRVRYRPELPLVLNGISANIKEAEKIGIVGRTGAGKSSLISTLLRLVECDSGSILIDGVDISKIGLHTLRSAISVIPQDPVLFQGSIRYNLDPFDEHSDEALWTALERSHLKKTVTKLPRKLLAEVEAAGENFSVGERQLICLARALLRHSKILLLDEATASVDLETDHLIQATIKEAFATCTVVTIAHRLNTIASYDRILVLHKGTVREFDTPAALMQVQGSIFQDMMAAMGVQTVEQMEGLS